MRGLATPAPRSADDDIRILVRDVAFALHPLLDRGQVYRVDAVLEAVERRAYAKDVTSTLSIPTRHGTPRTAHASLVVASPEAGAGEGHGSMASPALL